MLYFRTVNNQVISNKLISAAHMLVSGCSVLSDAGIRQIVPYMKGVVGEISISQIEETDSYGCLCDIPSVTRVAGFSDDTVEIRMNGAYKSLDCWDSGGYKIYFEDGTVIDVKYDEHGIWRVIIKKKGTAKYLLYKCKGDDTDKDYIDIFYIDAAISKTRKLK